MRFEAMVRAATSLRRLKKGSEDAMKPMRVVLLLRARPTRSAAAGGDGAVDAGSGGNASSMYLRAF